MSSAITSDLDGNIYPVSESTKLLHLRNNDPRFHKWSRGEIYRALAAQRFQAANGRSATDQELDEFVDFLARWSE